MTDAGWQALAQMVVALCAALAAIFAQKAGVKAQEAAQEARATNLQARETRERLITHEAASAARGEDLKAEVRSVGAVLCEPLGTVGAALQSFHPGSEGTVPPPHQG